MTPAGTWSDVSAVTETDLDAVAAVAVVAAEEATGDGEDRKVGAEEEVAGTDVRLKYQTVVGGYSRERVRNYQEYRAVAVERVMYGTLLHQFSLED